MFRSCPAHHGQAVARGIHQRKFTIQQNVTDKEARPVFGDLKVAPT